MSQFDITDENLGPDLKGASCKRIKSVVDSQDSSGDLNGSSLKDMETVFHRLFRCGFKITFSGALRRVFSGMNAIQNYEVTMMRRYACDKFWRGTCFVAEFSLQSECWVMTRVQRTVFSSPSFDSTFSQWSWEEIEKWTNFRWFHERSNAISSKRRFNNASTRHHFKKSFDQ